MTKIVFDLIFSHVKIQTRLEFGCIHEWPEYENAKGKNVDIENEYNVRAHKSKKQKMLWNSYIFL